MLGSYLMILGFNRIADELDGGCESLLRAEYLIKACADSMREVVRLSKWGTEQVTRSTHLSNAQQLGAKWS
jgi:hypothetical protein